MFRGRKANLGMLLFIGIILLQIGMYAYVRSANADPNFSDVGSYSGDAVLNINESTDTSTDVSFSDTTKWYSGFKISGLGLPWWADILYGGFVAILFALSLYALFRGLS